MRLPLDTNLKSPDLRDVLVLAFLVSLSHQLTQFPPLCFAGSRGGGGGYLISMHGCSRITLDPRIVTLPGRSLSAFSDQADIASTGRVYTHHNTLNLHRPCVQCQPPDRGLALFDPRCIRSKRFPLSACANLPTFFRSSSGWSKISKYFLQGLDTVKLATPRCVVWFFVALGGFDSRIQGAVILSV